MNRMPGQPIHDDMSIGHAINDAKLLALLKVDTTVTK